MSIKVKEGSNELVKRKYQRSETGTMKDMHKVKSRQSKTYVTLKRLKVKHGRQNIDKGTKIRRNTGGKERVTVRHLRSKSNNEKKVNNNSIQYRTMKHTEKRENIKHMNNGRKR